MERTYKPEAKYYYNEQLTLEDIEQAYRSDEAVTGRVVDYDEISKTLKVSLGNNIVGVLPWCETTIYEFTYPKTYEISHIPRQVIALIDRQIRAKIVGFNRGLVYLSRKNNMLETFKKIATDSSKKYNAVVNGKCKFGVFYDIGDGVTAFCHVTNFSGTRIWDVGSWVSIGENNVVQLISQCDAAENYKITCSRKYACSPEKNYYYYKQNQIITVRVSEPISTDGRVTGYFVEINPQVTGIADIADEEHTLRSGDRVLALIKKVNPDTKKIKLRIIAT